MRRPRVRTVIGWTAALALPLGLSSLISYALSVRHFEHEALVRAEANAQRAAEILRSGDALLAELARDTGGRCDASTISLMAHAVFHSRYFRESGIERDGELVCTSLEMLPPGFDIPNSKRLPAARIGAFEILAPTKTIRGGRSLILNRPLDAERRGFVNLLLDPVLLVERMTQADGLETSALLDDRPNGALIALGGDLPPAVATLSAPLAPGAHRGADGVYAIAQAAPYPVYAVVSIGEAGIAQHWRTQLQPAVALSFLLLLVTYLALRHRLQAQDAVDDLTDGIAAGEVEVEYQTIHDGQDRRVVGAEALVRWRHPRRGRVMPDEFIPLAERSGSIRALTDAVLERVAVDLATLRAKRPLPDGFRITINLARADLVEAGLLAALDARFGPGAPLDALGFEITEREMFGDVVGVARSLAQELARRGAEVALDDFGTGYSGLSNLRDLAPHHLKIDRSFIRALDTEAVTANLVGSVVTMARGLGIGVVAEGVETEAQRERLLALGVRVQQGWLYSKAEGIAALEARLAIG